MTRDQQQRHDLLLASIDKAIVGEGGSEAARHFATQYYAPVSFELLGRREARLLARVVLNHFELAEKRAPQQPLVVLTKPQAGSTSPHARLQTVFEDMPFLVDSIAIAVRAAGCSVDWSVHPVLRVKRDGAGGLQRIQHGGDSGAAESFVSMDITPLADAPAHDALQERVTQTLQDVALVVGDFPAMREAIESVAEMLQQPTKGYAPEVLSEACDFALWLRDNHFTFLGYAFAAASWEGNALSLEVDGSRCLGLLRPDACFGDADSVLAPADTLSRYAVSQRLVIITKANMRSHIHHPLTMDAVSIKQLDAEGQLVGTHRFIGLFSSDVYIDRPHRIPVIRSKVEEVMRRSRLSADSHSGKKLRDIIHQLPRDELFQSSEDELHELCSGVRALRDLHQLKLFLRRDRYGRFFSALVFLPRERYSVELREKICETLMRALDGSTLERSVDFPRGDSLARIHAIIHVRGDSNQAVDAASLEQKLLTATRSWREQLCEALEAAGNMEAGGNYADAFDAGYQQTVAPLSAAADVHYLQQLSETLPLIPRLVVDEDAVGSACPTEMRLYARGQPKALSDVLPTLEHFGLRVIRQSPYRVSPSNGETAWIQAFEVRVEHDCLLEPAAQKSLFEEAMLACLRGENEDDGLHRLVLAAGLDARQIVLLRTLTRYLLQTGLPFGRSLLEQLLAENAAVARDLAALVEARFDPDVQGDRQVKCAAIEERLEAALEAVSSLDTDRALRAYLGVARAILRTNYYQYDAQGASKRWVSIKLDPAQIPELPEPRPMFETFVYAPEVEGVHLRGGAVARGGLRWSDRHTDFRTEVLGLMKAQMVKNSIIVPVGAKGGFVVKQRNLGSREAIAEAGKACYRTFIRGLLDITDNRKGDEIVPPPRVVRADGDDPYLVVAADKGTASFSDVANALAAEYDFWLGDAFASGGSAGYDHKKMGITARGAWESVKRHFRELGKDIQREPFTVAGIGDMAGDVFGNGMLLSKQIRLVAAFNHLHIFIDPDPDPARSFEERQRLFDMGRSSWEDYDTACISEGGGVWRRDAKRIELSEAARQALGIDSSSVTPNALLRAILLAPVELLWNGGIGTYVKAQHESHQAVGDRANDAVRVNGRELRCRVIGEGGNLGLTQLGRIEYALQGSAGDGGYINTDAIDNSGGVHSSDREVNIKIPLNASMAAGDLDTGRRNELLESMTEDVAAAVLDDNHEQSLAVSLISSDAAQRLDEHAYVMRNLERETSLDRAVEYLPDDEALNERRTRRLGLTRPEIAVVLAYTKINLFDRLIESGVPDDAALEDRLVNYFPPAMREGYAEAIAAHRLRREIIATDLANQVVNRMGFAFVQRLAEEQGGSKAQVVKSFALAWRLMDADALVAPLDALDGKLDASVQLQLYQRIAGLIKHVTGWALAEHVDDVPLQQSLDEYVEPLAAIRAAMPEELPEAYRQEWDRAVAQWREQGVPEAVALRFATTLVMGSGPDIVQVARRCSTTPGFAARVYFELGARLDILWLLSNIIGLQVQGHYQALARANLREDTYRLHRRIAERVLSEGEGEDAVQRVDGWLQKNGASAERILRRIAELRTHSPHDFMTLAVGVRTLRQLRTL